MRRAGDVRRHPAPDRFVNVRLTRKQAQILRDFAYGQKAHTVAEVQALIRYLLGDT